MNRITKSLLIGLVTIISACSDEKSSTKQKASTESTAQSSGTPTDAQNKLQTKFVTIATGGASGPTNIYATTLANEYARVYGVNSKTQTTGASIENLNLFKLKKVEMAFLMSDTLIEAVEGKRNFSEPIKSIRQIATLYPNFVHIVVRADSDIKEVSDLRGKRVSVGAQNSATEMNTRAILKFFDISYDDIYEDYLGYAESAEALRAGRVDAAFLTTGIPNSSLMDLNQTMPFRLLALPPEKVEEIVKEETYFQKNTIPAGTYGSSPDVPTIAILNAMIVQESLSEDDVYKLTKTFFESLPKLRASHQSIKDVNVMDAQKGHVAPMHPGAKRYYDEVNARGSAEGGASGGASGGATSYVPGNTPAEVPGSTSSEATRS
ncbi:TAXI family TRAP transporter solute-binding subunit [Taylorella equigenitalis]|uniref:TRAP transporter solute receptor, TAXI family n=1 Tax=Taylorella equigenitalis (strain MCE9) TaxID=937774 RepID=A0A654KIQ1_TAYEM|nr:TAXI family TRAP transporter solute-binding subunit [Taylorella equigenitalis]ADU92204.1 TRAP transporter solute receptor, unknown substrate 1 [Taylorella equigenitalis MCE9]WDU56955.1 TAXI family TRAP transporter solute-binding subunit [Taylorella equigenitalis]